MGLNIFHLNFPMNVLMYFPMNVLIYILPNECFLCISQWIILWRYFNTIWNKYFFTFSYSPWKISTSRYLCTQKWSKRLSKNNIKTKTKAQTKNSTTPASTKTKTKIQKANFSNKHSSKLTVAKIVWDEQIKVWESDTKSEKSQTKRSSLHQIKA